MNKVFLTAFPTLAVLLVASPASAYCRTTTCSPNKSCAEAPEKCCVYDREGCDINRPPVIWPTSCVSYNTQEDGSPLRDISEFQLATVLEKAFDAWLSVQCGGEPISIAIEDRGPASCASPEFNDEPKDRNANVWMFQDNPEMTSNVKETGTGIDASSLAVSVITYDSKTGELVDVDVEFNSASAEFTVGDDDVNFDLQSVATHEAGHFLGLEHTLVPGATMRARYSRGDTEPRTLAADDQAGICAIYPPTREISKSNRTCEPYGRYSPKCNNEGCGCKIAGRPSGLPLAPGVALAVAGLALVSRRRRSWAARTQAKGA